MFNVSVSQLEHLREEKRKTAAGELAEKLAERYPQQLSQYSRSKLTTVTEHICNIADDLGLRTSADVECFVTQSLLFTPNLHTAKTFRQTLSEQAEGSRMVAAIAQMPPGAMHHLTIDDAPAYWLEKMAS